MLPRQDLSQGLDLAAVVAVAHAALAHPLCPNLSCVLARAVGEAQLDGSMHLHHGGPAAKLAREAQMACATLTRVTDYDCSHLRKAGATEPEVLQRLSVILVG